MTEPRKKSGLDHLYIKGGQRLEGTIRISGAKNAALPLLCASLLTEEEITFTNTPTTLDDIKTLSELLSELGVSVETSGDVAKIKAANINSHCAPYELVSKMRAGVLVLGPLLARLGKAEVSLPGGCAIGTRPVDLHIDGLRKMGAEIELEEGYIKASAPNGLKGARIVFPKVSVGATENLMMAAALAEGTTILSNAAREPEITDLAHLLEKMGAKIEGIDTAEIRITGAKKLRGAKHAIIPDRIETGTWLIACAMTAGKIRLQNARLDHLTALVAPLQEMGLDIYEQGGEIFAERKAATKLKSIDIKTDPYPGFPTDLQAQFMTLLTICEGTGTVIETIFENRFMHVPELARMGANIKVEGHTAIVRGVPKLKGAQVMATDLRASVALVLAALVAKGETEISRIYHLDRGYEDIVGKLGACGAIIERRPPEEEE